MNCAKLLSILPIFSLCFTASKGWSQIPKPTVIISTDIGGSDPDDYQSMIHLFMYADQFALEGLISSPPDQGRAEHIYEVIEAYEMDYAKLVVMRPQFPQPSKLRSVVKQGAIDAQATLLPESLSEGAAFIIDKARQAKDYLWILVWGSMTDVAQALKADSKILPKIRVYSIGSWNTMQDTLSRNYIYNHHPNLWWIENDETFRGMYMGGYQGDGYSNTTFVENYVKDYGALGALFWQKKKDIKMGDTPSVLYLLNGDPNDPTTESWGGRFIRTGHGPNYFHDVQDPDLIENGKHGAKTVNHFRKEYLKDWANRMRWLE